MRLALVQMPAVTDLDKNLQQMRAYVVEAAKQGASFVVFPEMAYLQGSYAQVKEAIPRYDEFLDLFAVWAKELRIHLAPGSLREPGAGDRHYNTMPIFAPDGRLIATYRKIFLFRADVPGDRVYEESVHTAPGDAVITVDIDGIRVGLTICFDLRFPELYRALRRRGAQLVLVPSAFTAVTGAAHWEALLRARAIENQLFIAAPGQTGTIGEGRPAYGHSAIYSPWGEPIAALGAEEGVLVTDIDPALIAEAERRVSAWSSRRDDLFPLA